MLENSVKKPYGCDPVMEATSISSRCLSRFSQPEQGETSMTPSRAETELKADVQAILWSMRLSSVTRFLDHRFWEPETTDAKRALQLEPRPRLESVAEHSWHVADSVLMLASRFPALDANRCLTLAILHDKLEIITGDWPACNPVGNESAKVLKRRYERKA